MSEPGHTSPNPLGEAAPKEDRVGLAANAMASAMALVVANVGFVTWATARAARNSGITSRETIQDGLAVNIVIYGTAFAVFLGAMLAWVLMASIDSNYRRGGLAMVAAFGGFLASVLLTMLVRGLVGEPPLLLLGIAAIGVSIFFGRRARAAA